MRRIYLDAGILILAHRSKASAEANKAAEILEEVGYHFLSCPFLEFEVIPNARRNRNKIEERAYQLYFEQAESCTDLSATLDLAFEEASRSPGSGIDALHVAAARLLRAGASITTGRPGRSIYQNSLVPVVYFYK